jgi:cysteine-rich repeat protein
MADGQEMCLPNRCGDGKLDPGEACDDGNNTSGDGCPAICGAACGDRHLDPGEVCDDGNTVSADGCAADCKHVEVCGNGTSDPGEACDDGNLQSQDGCSSRCSLETPTWMTIAAVPSVGPGYLAYDAARGAIALVDASQQTWEWDGAHWLHRTPRIIPRSIRADIVTPMLYESKRQRVVLLSEHGWDWDGGDWSERLDLQAPQVTDKAAVYDPVRRRLVLITHESTRGDIWESDGVGWLTTGSAPTSHAIAFDSKRGKVMLYVGNGAGPISIPDTGPGGDLFEYDGRSWTPQQSLDGPKSERQDMAYDAARGQLVVFAVLHDPFFQRFTETWTWDGARWDKRVAGSGPELRTRAAMAYDVVHRQLLLFGGQHYMSPNGFGDTWVWSGVDWQRPEATAPPPRTHHAMVYEAGRATGVLFGGLDATRRAVADTWLWNGSAWRAAAGGPSARADHAMAYDAIRDRTVLFGGTDVSSQALADTWEWDGMRWLERAPGRAPIARGGHAMVYDAARQQLVMFGGRSDTWLSDQWLWTGTEWIDITPAVRPEARSDAAMAYDAERGRIVLFGGRGELGVLSDVWEWDGTRWTQPRSSPIDPPARAGHALIYDPVLRRVVLFGGHDGFAALNDTWTWDGSRWTELITAEVPPAREHHAMMYDPARRQLVMFAGEASVVLGDLWLWRYRDETAPEESCESGFDGDGDGKIGCGDPDCSARCTACGDGVCGALEHCRLCPVDCGPCDLCGDLVCDSAETCTSCPGDCGSCP